MIAEAMRSMEECAASDNMPSEPVRSPVMSLSSVISEAAKTEKIAAERLAACGGLELRAWPLGSLERCYRFGDSSASAMLTGMAVSFEAFNALRPR